MTEPDRGDGRKVHYGSGEQPWDIIKAMGWGPEFCAGNILKYLRRDKAPEHSRESARVYYKWLCELCLFDAPRARQTQKDLYGLLTPEERGVLEA